MTANLRTLTEEKREVPMTDTRVAAGNCAHLAARTKAFGVIPNQMIWGILACCFIFVSSQLSHATGACNTVTGGNGVGVADNNTVLMLATTLTDNTGSPTGNLCTSVEAVQANALNFNVEIDDAAAWGAKSTANFATYRAIVLGDPDCVFSTTPIAEAESTTGTWGPAITGPVAIVGTDPEFHFLNSSGHDAAPLTQNAIALATSSSGQPGAYISLSCYYGTSLANTPVPVLVPFGSFTAAGQTTITGSTNNSHIVAPTNALVTTPNALTDAGLSNWNESTHEAFNSFPGNFTAVVQSVDLGLPYILTGIPPQTQPVSTGTTTFYEFQNHAFGYTAQLNTGSTVNVTITPVLKSQADCNTLVQKNTNFHGALCFVYKDANGSGADSSAMFELICPPPGNCTLPASFDAELGTNFTLTASEPGFNPADPFPGWLKGDGGVTGHPCTPNPDGVTPLFKSNQIDSYQPTRIDNPDPYVKGGSGGTGSCWVSTYNQPDEVAPGIKINSPTATTYTLNQTVPASYLCSDPASSKLPEVSNLTGPYLTNLPASCVGTVPNGTNIDTSAAALGPHTFTVNAIDTGTNTASISVNYRVGYQSSGLCDGDVGHQVLQPINTPPQALSVFKGGRTVPVKFRVCDANGVSIGTPGVVTSNPFTCTIAGSTGNPIDETIDSNTPDTSFRWDPTGQQWIFNWGTKGLPAGGTVYSCTITLNDTSKILFNLALR